MWKRTFYIGFRRICKDVYYASFQKYKQSGCVDFKATVTNEFQKKYGFKFAFLPPISSFPLLEKVENPVAIIATYHSDHSSLAYDIFKTSLRTTIFIEKRPTVTVDDLDKLIELFNKGQKLKLDLTSYLVGFRNTLHGWLSTTLGTSVLKRRLINIVASLINPALLL